MAYLDIVYTTKPVRDMTKKGVRYSCDVMAVGITDYSKPVGLRQNLKADMSA